MVVPVLDQVPDPGEVVVITLLLDLEVPDLHPGNRV